MSSSDAQQNEELKKELQEVKNEMNAKIEELTKELEEVKGKNGKLEKELREQKKDHRQRLIGSMDYRRHQVNRRRRNLPAELKVEIVDCLPVENAANFLANMPNRIIIHHCAPRIRRMLRVVGQMAAGYASILPAANSIGLIRLKNGHKYTPEMDIFLRYGAAHCNWYIISADGNTDGFVGYPTNFFNDLIKHYFQTKVPTKAIRDLHINLPLQNPAPWPAALVQPQAWEMKLEESKVVNIWGYCVLYILRNKHNPGVAFKLYISGDTKCQQMISFRIWRMADV